MTSSSETEFDRDIANALALRCGENYEGSHDGRGLRIGIACARFNGGITTRLLTGVLDVLAECGVDRSDTIIAWTPGAFEIPLLARAFVTSVKPVDAVITLGAVIRGDTGHYEFVAGECARGVQEVQLSSGVPVIFGVLTTNTVEQAMERSKSDASNKGREAAYTALEMVSLLRQGSLAHR